MMDNTALVEAFRTQSRACDKAGSRFMAGLLHAAADEIAQGWTGWRATGTPPDLVPGGQEQRLAEANTHGPPMRWMGDSADD